MPESFSLLVLRGDGIGPEVVDCTLRVIEQISRSTMKIDMQEAALHGAAWDSCGEFCPQSTLDAAHEADAILVGAVGGPTWDHIRVPGGPEMQDGLMRLRYELGTYIGLRPARSWDCLIPQSPYRPDLVKNVDLVVLREMTGGAFFTRCRGIERSGDKPRRAYDLCEYDEIEIARIADAGFQLAQRRRRKLVSLDKSNVTEVGVLWREVVDEVAMLYPDVNYRHLLADNASFQLACNPGCFDVILADNLFGDLISDQAGAVVGSLAMLPSASLVAMPREGERTKGLYEPVHGSAPDIAGTGMANPLGTILSAAMLFRYSYARPDLAEEIELAVSRTLAGGARTRDLGGRMTSLEMTNAVLANMVA